MTRFLVTGGAGFIGSHIAEEIIEKDLGEVVIFDDLSSGFESNIKHLDGKIRFVEEDVRNLSVLEREFKGIDYILHNAAFVSAFDSFNKPEKNDEINIVGTHNVLRAAQSAGVKRVVLASSAAIYGTESDLPNSEDMLPKPESPYAAAKICNESYARIFARHLGLETVSLRFFNVYGPRQDPSSEYSGVISRFVDQVMKGEQITVYGDGNQTRDFIYVKDIARAAILAVTGDTRGRGEAINLGTGKETSLLELIDVLGKEFGKEIKPEFASWREGDIKRSVAKVDRAKELLGFEAKVEFGKGINELVKSLCNSYYYI